MNGEIPTDFLHRLVAALIHFLWQGAGLAVAAALSLHGLKRQSSRIRYGVSAMFMLLMAIVPVMTFAFFRETGGAIRSVLTIADIPVRELDDFDGCSGSLQDGSWALRCVPFTLLTGTVENPGGPSPAFEGAVSGNTVRFKTRTFDGDRTISFAGTVNGDQITFSRAVEVRPGGGPGQAGIYGAFGPASFIALRQGAGPSVSAVQQAASSASPSAAVAPRRQAVKPSDLVGSWRLSQRGCSFLGNQPVASDLKVTFNNDGTFSLSDSSQVLTQGSWKLEGGKMAFSSAKDILVPPQQLRFNEYFLGLVQFHEDNNLHFNRAYMDGCDNVWKKV